MNKYEEVCGLGHQISLARGHGPGESSCMVRFHVWGMGPGGSLYCEVPCSLGESLYGEVPCPVMELPVW